MKAFRMPAPQICPALFCLALLIALSALPGWRLQAQPLDSTLCLPQQWTLGGVSRDQLARVQVMPDGGVILVGESRSGASGNKSSNNLGEGDYWIKRLDANGQSIWDVSLGGGSQDVATAFQYVPGTPVGDLFLIGGYSYTTGVSSTKTAPNKDSLNADVWVAALDSAGNLSPLGNFVIASPGEDFLEDMHITLSGSLLLGISSNGGVGYDKTDSSRGGFDYWVVNVDLAGNVLNQATLGGPLDDRVARVTPTLTNEFLIGGTSSSDRDTAGGKFGANKGGSDYWVVLTDTALNRIWDNNYGGPADEVLATVRPGLPGQGFYVGGSTESDSAGDVNFANRGQMDYWAIQISAAGGLLNQVLVGGGGNDMLKDLVPMGNGVLAIGTSNSELSGEKSSRHRGGGDLWVGYLSSLTTAVEWQRTLGGLNFEEAAAFSNDTLPPSGGYLGATSRSGIGAEKEAPAWGSQEDFWVLRFQAPPCSEPRRINTDNPDRTQYAPGDSIVVDFSAIGVYGDTNSFFLQLSDSTGDFANPTVLGQLADTLGGTFRAQIPSNQPFGSQYRVRVVANTPNTIGDSCRNPFSISVPYTVSVQAENVSCDADSNGAAIAQITGGQPPYRILWSTGDTVDSIGGLAPGAYGLRVTDQNGQVLEDTAFVRQDSVLSVSPQDTLVFPGDSVALVASGAPQSWWSNGFVGDTLSFSPTTDTGFVVSDTLQDGCITRDTALVRVNQLRIDLMTPSPWRAGDTVFVQVSTQLPFGAGNTYTIELSDTFGNFVVNTTNLSTTNNDTTVVVPVYLPYSLLPDSTYRVRVSSSNPTQTSEDNGTDIIIENPLTIVVDTVSDVLCGYTNNGFINLTVRGGIPPYVITWSHGPMTEDVTGLAAGSYSVQVSDAQGVQLTDTFQIEADTSINAQVQVRPAPSGIPGEFELIPLVRPGDDYQFLWTEDVFPPSGIPSPDSVYTVSHTAPTDYILAVTGSAFLSGALECTDTVNFRFEGDTTVVTWLDSTGPFSPGDTLDSLYFASNGPFRSGNQFIVQLSDSGGDFSNATNLDTFSGTVPDTLAPIPLPNGLPDGIRYRIRLVSTDAADTGGAYFDSLSIFNPFTIIDTVNDAVCDPDTNGSIHLGLNGGVPPYTVLWNTGDTTLSLSGLSSDTFTVEITEQLGRVLRDTFVVNLVPTEVLTLNRSDAQACFGDTVQVTASGNFVDYAWSTGDTTPTVTQPLTTTTTFWVTATDPNGCIATDTTQIQLTARQIAGAVTDTGGFPVGGLPVYLLYFDPTDSSLLAVDSMVTRPLGDFFFAPPDSEVFVWVQPDPFAFEGQMPAYHGGDFIAFSAQAVQSPSCGDTIQADVQLIPSGYRGGPCRFSGRIFAQDLGGAVTTNPSRNARVYLVNGEDEPVRYTTTDQSGYFEFTILRSDTYRVYLDSRVADNILAAEVWMDLEYPRWDSLQFVNRLTHIELLTPQELPTARPQLAAPQWSVFPNPAAGQVQVAGLPSPSAQLHLYDLQGRYLRSFPPGAETLQVAYLAPGLYLLRMQAPGYAPSTKRLVVQPAR